MDRKVLRLNESTGKVTNSSKHVHCLSKLQTMLMSQHYEMVMFPWADGDT